MDKNINRIFDLVVIDLVTKALIEHGPLFAFQVFTTLRKNKSLFVMICKLADTVNFPTEKGYAMFVTGLFITKLAM